ncbi:MAG: leucine-rich repeat domain-containing protein, partial [Candidatus Methanofastidiosa archaeon]|nr:leucine-rich repeat domain-containing protein [Candidatus Methanofastidiosa archaeon]
MRKRKIYIILSVTVLALAVLTFVIIASLSGSSFREAKNPEYYTKGVEINNGEVVGYTGDDRTVIIPAKYSGRDVVGIADGAFSSKNIEAVYIPDTVRYIGENAFSNNPKLKTIRIGSQIEKVGPGAFDKTSWINGKNGAVYVGKVLYCFIGDIKGGFYEIKEDTVSIAENAFAGNLSLNKIILGINTEVIGTGAFKDCENLSEIVAGNKLHTVGENCFKNTAWFSAQDEGEVFLGKILYQYKGEMPDSYTCIIPEGAV